MFVVFSKLINLCNREKSSSDNQNLSFIKRDPMSANDWTDLPLLPSIADRLGLIDLIRFRAVCKDWYDASSTASAEIEALPDHEPWLLLFGDHKPWLSLFADHNSQCSLVTEHSTVTKTIDIPQLNGTICLASDYGWLLLFREGSMFFFCPFSRAQIDLPGPFPRTVISNHVAMFSAPPTSKDCVVGVLSRTEKKLEFYTVHRGDTYWTEHTTKSTTLGKLQYAGYHKGKFYFFDDRSGMVRFLIEKPELSVGRVGYATTRDERSIPLFFGAEDEMKKRLLPLEDGSEVSICGTIVPSTLKGRTLKKMVRYVNHGVAKKQGAWFQPRFHQISDNQIW